MSSILVGYTSGRGNITQSLAIVPWSEQCATACKVLTRTLDIKPGNILIETREIDRMFDTTPSDAFRPEGLPQDRSLDYYMASVQVSSDREDLSRPTDLSVRLADFGTCEPACAKTGARA